ncbi:GAF and ANTAR domain-containing protein [Nocardia sp. 348MFTsu5.1]|uniref:GAF and ANTAR domain-containing protein n=1 Tax=Nocardia sp. 348MFTsu5.1 TaxID=1172185 RepID=UPI00056A253F|nr:GAF and ANTAR domain-containing protein [Nocardia sp. 348MFTsu5.1]
MQTSQLELSRRMADVARSLRAESDDIETVLRAISKAAIDSIPGTEYASVTLVTGKSRVETPVAIGDLAGRSDALQQELGEGPCIRSAIGEKTVWIDDMRDEARWPRFAAAADALGIASMICFSLYVEGDQFSALNLHSTTPSIFDDEARSIGQLFADHASVALSSVREKEQLRTALNSRDLIGQAKGMIMERYHLDSTAAFRLLAKLSQDSNVKLVDVAQRVVDAGPEDR